MLNKLLNNKRVGKSSQKSGTIWITIGGRRIPIDAKKFKKYKLEKQDYLKLQEKNIVYFTKSGSKNTDIHKGLNKNQIDIVNAFEKLNGSRVLNEISEYKNKNMDLSKFSKEDISAFEKVEKYLSLKKPYDGKIVRLMRDDSGFFDKYNIGDKMEFTKYTSFGKDPNDFKIKGGNLKIHIEKNTRGVDIENLMMFKEEREVLIRKGSYKVINKKPGHIYLEEI